MNQEKRLAGKTRKSCVRYWHIRKQIAEANGIEYAQTECTHRFLLCVEDMSLFFEVISAYNKGLFILALSGN